MSEDQDLEKKIRDLQLATSSDLDQKILGDCFTLIQNPSPPNVDLHNRENLMTGQNASRNHRRLSRVIPAITVLGVLLILAVWGTSRPATSWAQVVEAVQEKPWIRMSGKSPDGKDVESWLSIKKEISAHRSPDHVSFANFNENIIESYIPQIDQILRIEAGAQSSDRKSFDVFSAMFQGIYRGDEKLDIEKSFGEIPEIVKINQSRRQVREDDGLWIDYDITIQAKNEPPGTMTIRVAAESRLPHSMTAKNGDESMTFYIDYPAVGPKSIYDLGVAKTTKVSDSRPQTPTGDAQKIIEAIRSASSNFDDYYAIQVTSQPESPWHVGFPLKIWRKGSRLRVEMGFIDPDHPPTDEIPNAGADQRDWWKTHSKQLWFRSSHFYDGQMYYSNAYAPRKFVPEPNETLHPYRRRQKLWGKTEWEKKPNVGDWSGKTVPILGAYPKNVVEYLTRSIYTAKILPDAEGDVPGAILVQIQWSSGTVAQAKPNSENNQPVMRNEIKYRLDPKRSHVLLDSSTSTYYEENGERVILSQVTKVHKDFRKSPKGFWYPTLSQDTHAHTVDNELKTTVNVSRYYLDFDTEISDDLFKVQE